MVYANLFSRLVGWVIDFLIMLPVALLIHHSEIGKRLLLSQSIFMFIECSYYVYFWIKKGATPGMMLLGIEMHSYDSLSLWRAILRYIGLYISIASLGLGSLVMVWDRKKQTLQDKIGRTIVVKAKDECPIHPSARNGEQFLSAISRTEKSKNFFIYVGAFLIGLFFINLGFYSVSIYHLPCSRHSIWGQLSVYLAYFIFGVPPVTLYFRWLIKDKWSHAVLKGAVMVLGNALVMGSFVFLIMLVTGKI